MQKIEGLQKPEKELNDSNLNHKEMILSARALENRRKNPTEFREGDIQISSRVTRNRRKETFKAAADIHGGLHSSRNRFSRYC